MTNRTRHLCIVLTAQLGLLAVGLWMQYRYAVASALRAAEEQAWSDIEAGAGVFLSELHGVALGNLSPQGAGYERMARWVKAYRPVLGEVLIVDGQWRRLFPRTPSAGSKSIPDEPGPVVEWRPNEDEPGDANERLRLKPVRGRLSLENRPHLAVAGSLSNDQGYVIIHRPVAEIEAASREVVGALPATSAMSFVWMGALLSILAYMVLARVHDALDKERSKSATDTLRQSQHLVRTRDAVIFGLAKLTESRDPDTGDHLERISVYSTTLATALRRHPKFSQAVTPSFVRLIGISSALHDIGKVGVEDRILLKRGPLTSTEREAMQAHTTIAGQCLREIEQRLGGSNFLQMAREIAMGHHERWDGQGYPRKIAAESIPLSARIVAVADMYDALSSHRIYKDAMPHDECVAMIRAEAGKKLDPDIVHVWLSMEAQFRRIAHKYADRGDPADPPPTRASTPSEDLPAEEDNELCAWAAEAKAHVS